MIGNPPKEDVSFYAAYRVAAKPSPAGFWQRFWAFHFMTLMKLWSEGPEGPL